MRKATCFAFAALFVVLSASWTVWADCKNDCVEWDCRKIGTGCKKAGQTTAVANIIYSPYHGGTASCDGTTSLQTMLHCSPKLCPAATASVVQLSNCNTPSGQPTPNAQALCYCGGSK